MKFRILVPTLLLLVATALLAQVTEVRSWKDVTGRTIQAEFVQADEQTVTLRIGGKEYPLPLTKLSAEDQAWIKQRLAPASPLTPTVSPTATAPGELKIAGVAVKPGTRMEFETPLSEALTARVKKFTDGKDSYDDVDMTKAQVGLFVPANFNPAKSWPIMIASVTDSGRTKGRNPSSVRAMGAFVDAAKELGWVVIGVDCPGNLTPGLPANRAALAEAGLEAMAAAWPASKDWPVSTGGFSGGAKYSGWLGGWFAKAGRKVHGIFMGGVNEDMATMALDEWNAPRKEFTQARVFVSTGKEDKTAGPAKTEAVVKSLKRSGFEVKEEFHDGGHETNKDHVLAAMKWFADPARGAQ